MATDKKKERAVSVAVAASKVLSEVLKRLKIDTKVVRPHPRHTHASMAGGSYRAAEPEDRRLLMDAYCAALDAGRKDLHLVEQPDAAAMPLLVDLDFRLPTGERERMYDAETVVDFLKGYVRCAGEYLEADRYEWYVLEKPAPRPKKEEDKDGVWQDGIHMVCPAVVASAAVQRAIRADFLVDPYYEGFFEALGTAAPEDAYDLSVLKTNAWMMYGSRKAKGDPSAWTATRVVEVWRVSSEHEDEEEGVGSNPIRIESRPVATDGKKASALARLLSVHRDPGAGSALTERGRAVDAAAEEEAGIEKRRMPTTKTNAAAVAAAAPGTSGLREPLGPEAARELAEVVRLVRMLKAARSEDEREWMRVGWCLRNVAADEGRDDPRFEAGCAAAWDAFSRLSAKYVEGEPAAKWAKMAVRGTDERRLTMGTLVEWARADLPNDAEFGRPAQNAVWGKEMDLLRVLRDTFPQLGIGASDGVFRVVSADDSGVEFEDASAGVEGKGLSGKIDAPCVRTGYWGHTVSVRDAATGESRFMGLLYGGVPVRGPMSQLHHGIPASADSFVFTQPEEHMAMLSSVTPNVPAEIKLHHPSAGAGGGSFLNITVPGTVACKVLSRNKVDMFRSQVCRAVEQHNLSHTLNLFVGQVGQLVVNNNGSASEDAHRRAFVKLRDVAMEDAKRGRLRKLGGHIWRPVPGCPTAYEQAESYKDFLNRTLDNEPLYHDKPAYQKELLEYLANYNPASLRDIEFDRCMLSFADGVVVASDQEPEARFVPYASAEGHAQAEEGKVARHHIAQLYAPLGTPTPLFDSVLERQFSPEVAETLMVLLGRLHFPVGTHDNWQVMPWLVGTAGTGKSVVQDVVSAMFSASSTGTLTGNQEQTFGLDGKYNCHVLLGRDLPRKMSTVLSQELLQCMVSGERMCVPRKNQLALEVKWTVPALFASNQHPDYGDGAGQVARRVVPFRFGTPVAEPDPTLLQRILEAELPALVTRMMEAYLSSARTHGQTGFWRWCPAKLLAAQKEAGIAMSYVKRFLALGPDDEQAVTNCGEVVYLAKVEGVVTSIKAISAAYTQFTTPNAIVEHCQKRCSTLFAVG